MIESTSTMQSATKNILCEDDVPAKVPASNFIKILNKNCAEVLGLYGLEYETSGHYLKVGEISSKGQWVLHISVVKRQLSGLLLDLIPFLVNENVPFRFVRNEEIAGQFLDGTLGFQNLGKLTCIYPENESRALFLAEKLIFLTTRFKGPAIPTDRWLGGCVYTEYVNNPFNCVPDSTGSNVDYRVQFRMPKGVSWPFKKIAKPGVPKRRKFLEGKYLPVLIVKSDCKGCVYKAVNFKKVFRPEWCLIKEGRRNMCSDDQDRDIGDRLEWQWFLHNELTHYVSIPKPIEIFEYRGNSFLVMEFIEGVCLNNWLGELYQDFYWDDLTRIQHILIIDLSLAILDIVERLHSRGFVHRDLSPENFIIDKNGRLVLIDLELTYSTQMRRPSPPFKWGTPGFMSPEQMKADVPTVAEDIFGVGALIFTMFTGISPEKIDIHINTAELPLILRDLISLCTSATPENRPPIIHVRDIIFQFRKQIGAL